MEKKYLAIVIICLGWLVSFPTALYLYQLMNPFYVPGPTPMEELYLVRLSFIGTSNTTGNTIQMVIQNAGQMPWTLTNKAQVNSFTGLPVASFDNNPAGALNCSSGNQVKVYITTTPASGGWVSGNKYSITLLTTKGTNITNVSSAP